MEPIDAAQTQAAKDMLPTAKPRPVAEPAAPVAEPAPPVAEPAVPPAESAARCRARACDVEPAPAVAEPVPSAAPTADRQWIVEPGESLWLIVQEAYGASDTASTVSLTDLVFSHNSEQLSDPDVLSIGMTLLIPAI